MRFLEKTAIFRQKNKCDFYRLKYDFYRNKCDIYRKKCDFYRKKKNKSSGRAPMGEFIHGASGPLVFFFF